MQEYHADFWLLIGTAAPLIALAHGVALQPARREAIARLGSVRKPTRIQRVLIWAPIVVAATGLLGCVEAFAGALTSTYREQDMPDAAASGFILGSSLLLLVYPAFIDSLLSKRAFAPRPRPN